MAYILSPRILQMLQTTTAHRSTGGTWLIGGEEHFIAEGL